MLLDDRNGHEGAPEHAGAVADVNPVVLGHAGALSVAGTEGAHPLFDETVAQPADRSHEVFRLERNPDTYEVSVESDHGLEDYREMTHPEDWALLEHEARPLQGTRWVFINPTMEGGGVAMIRPPAVELMNDLGVEAHWYVMAPIKDPGAGDPFLFTKQMHNVSQRQSEERITEEGKALHRQWADTENGPVLEAQEPIQNADFIVIDDPQPAPLIRRLKRANPNAQFIWRNHIDTDHNLMADPSTPQGEVASYLLDELGVRDVDAVLAHPVHKFIHPGMEDKTYYGPATVDPFDNLNRHLSPEEVEEGITFINDEITAKNTELIAAGRTHDVQPLLDTDPERQRVTLIARFDPSKGMDKAMEMGVQTRRKMRDKGVPEAELPEVVIVGNGSIDDPDGGPMFDAMLKLRRERYPEEADGIIVMRLKHNYDAMNALMSRSSIVMQTSDAEGLETRVSDAIQHGKPVVVSNRGGIHTQVIEGQSGIVLDYDKPGHDLDRGSDFMSRLLTDPAAYAAMLESTVKASGFNRREFTTTANVTRFLRIGNRLRQYPHARADKIWKVSDMSDMGAERPEFAEAA